MEHSRFRFGFRDGNGNFEQMEMPSFVLPKKEVTYPGDFFGVEAKKPPLRIMIDGNDPDEIASAIVSGDETNFNLVDVHTVNYMIYKQLEAIKATLPEKWESFGVVIGNEGDIVTPLSLLEVTLSSKDDTEPKAKLGLVSRRCTATTAMGFIFDPIAQGLRDEAHRSNNRVAASSRVRSLISAHSEIVVKRYKNWKGNKTYLCLAAALDMFLERFPDHSASWMRKGTRCTRYMCCNAIPLLQNFATIMDTSVDEVISWIWCGEALKNVNKLQDPRNELSNPHSYSPYFYCMSLGNKSVNSIAENIHLHAYVHAVGAILGIEQSKNARVPRDDGTVVFSSQRIAFAVGALKKLHDRREASSNDMSDELPEFANGPPTMDPKAWFRYVKKHKLKFQKYGAKIAAGLTDVRPRTVGEQLVCTGEIFLIFHS